MSSILQWLSNALSTSPQQWRFIQSPRGHLVGSEIPLSLLGLKNKGGPTRTFGLMVNWENQTLRELLASQDSKKRLSSNDCIQGDTLILYFST